MFEIADLILLAFDVYFPDFVVVEGRLVGDVGEGGFFVIIGFGYEAKLFPVLFGPTPLRKTSHLQLSIQVLVHLAQLLSRR